MVSGSDQFRLFCCLALLALTEVAHGQSEGSVAASTTNAPAAQSGEPREVHFANDVMPILSRFGCNTSGCHGKAEGQNGFKLSVFGSDLAADYSALVEESRGRRVTAIQPSQSLLLQKASGGVAHGGGVRIRPETPEYQMLLRWIQNGVPVGSADAPHVVSLRIEPAERVLAFRQQQPLKVIGVFSDGTETDVTHHARFQSNRDTIAAVDEFGLVTAQAVPGDVAIMAAYLECTAVFTALIPRGAENAPTNAGSPNSLVPEVVSSSDPLDKLVAAKLTKLRIEPSHGCDDATYLRRVSLDLIGVLPTAAEARKFLADPGSDKRGRVVESLMKRPEFADYWALKWADWLRVERQALGHRGAYAYYKWIRDSFAANKPLDRFARELVEAEGLLSDHPAGHFYKVAKDSGEAAAMLSQALLGVRIDCAKCHHHPFDRWGQDDYFGMQAFFAPLAFKATPRGEMLLASKTDSVRHARTQQVVLPHALGTVAPEKLPPGDPRHALADWVVSADNPFFARNIANRTWAHFLGRGIIDPVDDIRTTNPPSNPELLTELSQQLVKSGYDFRALLRSIVASRTYQLASTVNETNATDEQNHSRALLRQLDAEVLLDAICDVTGVSEKFDGFPAGARAVQLWDNQVGSYFLSTNGRPARVTACDCERVGSPSVSQVLHVLNSPVIEAKLSHANGLLPRLVREKADDNELLEEIYLTYFGRFPTEEERALSLRHLRDAGLEKRSTAAEDIAWSMLNSLEFRFNH